MSYVMRGLDLQSISHSLFSANNQPFLGVDELQTHFLRPGKFAIKCDAADRNNPLPVGTLRAPFLVFFLAQS